MKEIHDDEKGALPEHLHSSRYGVQLGPVYLGPPVRHTTKILF